MKRIKRLWYTHPQVGIHTCATQNLLEANLECIDLYYSIALQETNLTRPENYQSLPFQGNQKSPTRVTCKNTTKSTKSQQHRSKAPCNALHEYVTVKDQSKEYCTKLVTKTFGL